MDANHVRSDGTVLDLGSSDEMDRRLAGLEHDGGVASVVHWAQEELTPGRAISYKGRHGEQVETAVLTDRSVWRLDGKGQVVGGALLPPLTDEKYGTSELFALWSRPLSAEPYTLRVRTKVGGAGAAGR